MAIDKSLYGAPEGIEALAMDEAPIEIEIVNPEGVSIGIDGVEIDLMPEDENEEEEFDSNLAEFMSESDLQKIAGGIMELIEAMPTCSALRYGFRALCRAALTAAIIRSEPIAMMREASLRGIGTSPN